VIVNACSSLLHVCLVSCRWCPFFHSLFRGKGLHVLFCVSGLCVDVHVSGVCVSSMCVSSLCVVISLWVGVDSFVHVRSSSVSSVLVHWMSSSVRSVSSNRESSWVMMAFVVSFSELLYRWFTSITCRGGQYRGLRCKV